MSEEVVSPSKGVTSKSYVLGRRIPQQGGIVNIGRYYALDRSLGSDVYIDILRPHIILVCGKRGYGKSYTIGVFFEEMARLEDNVKNNLSVIIFDTLGIYWTTRIENKESLDELHRWQLHPQGFDIQLLVPNPYVNEYNKNGIDVDSFSIRVSELTPYHWCQLFEVSPTQPLGILLTRAVLHVKETHQTYGINDLLSFIQQDQKSNTNEKGAAENCFTIAKSWGIFDKEGVSIHSLVQRGKITVLDVSLLPSQTLKDIIASLIGQRIFTERIRARKIHEQQKMGKTIDEKGIPMVWMAIDEAQLIIPHDKKSLGKEVFIDEWMRQGRQPGLSLIMATQRPSALHPEVLSHCDIILSHRLTAQEDIDALSRIRPTYMHGSIQDSIQKIGDERGVAFILDDTSEACHIIKIRPRLSWHGGAESVVFEG